LSQGAQPRFAINRSPPSATNSNPASMRLRSLESDVDAGACTSVGSTIASTMYRSRAIPPQRVPTIKAKRTRLESTDRYSAIPPHTPQHRRSVALRCNRGAEWVSMLGLSELNVVIAIALLSPTSLRCAPCGWGCRAFLLGNLCAVSASQTGGNQLAQAVSDDGLSNSTLAGR